MEYTNEYGVYGDPRFPRADSPLKRKKILFCGDSICAAAVYDYKELLRWGWALRISSATGAKVCNLGLDGASFSTCRGENRIIRQILFAEGTDPEIIVLHGGVNEAWDSNEPGKMTAGFEPSSFDVATCAGGFEELLYETKKRFPKAKICYIANYAGPSCRIGRISNMDDYFDEIVKICKKWEIPCLDLYHNAEFSKEFRVTEKVYTADYIHPNAAGYDVLYKPVQAFLEGLVR